MRRVVWVAAMAIILFFGATAPAYAAKPQTSLPPATFTVQAIEATDEPAVCRVLLGWNVYEPLPRGSTLEGYQLAMSDAPDAVWADNVVASFGPEEFEGSTTFPNESNVYLTIRAVVRNKSKGKKPGTLLYSDWGTVMGADGLGCTPAEPE